MNKKKFCLKLLILLKYFSKVILNNLFIFFLKNFDINDILYLSEIILNKKDILSYISYFSIYFNIYNKFLIY